MKNHDNHSLKFTIVTPCYNCCQYIESCILSVMHQTYSNFEHIIIDGGSTDGTLKIIEKYSNLYNMTYISEPDQGMYDAINKGFNFATGDVFSWLNADDSYMPWTLETLSKIFENEEYEWVTGIPALMDSNGTLYSKKNFDVRTYSQRAIAKGKHHGRGRGFIQQESTFWRRELWEESNGLNVAYKYAGDFDLWKRFAKLTPLYSVNTILSAFRVHDGQKSADFINYYGEIEDYCTISTFIWWIMNKALSINRFYYFLNRKMLICIHQKSKQTEKKKLSALIQYFERFIIK